MPLAWLSRPLASLHLLTAVFALLELVGLVMVLSASTADSYARQGPSYAVFEKQVMYVGAGLAPFWLALRSPLSLVRRAGAPLLVASTVLLAAMASIAGPTSGPCRTANPASGHAGSSTSSTASRSIPG